LLQKPKQFNWICVDIILFSRNNNAEEKYKEEKKKKKKHTINLQLISNQISACSYNHSLKHRYTQPMLI